MQERFLARDYAGAAAAVPFEFIDRTSLLGNRERIGERLRRLADGGVTSISVSCFDGDLEGKIGHPDDSRAGGRARPEPR